MVDMNVFPQYRALAEIADQAVPSDDIVGGEHLYFGSDLAGASALLCVPSLLGMRL